MKVYKSNEVHPCVCTGGKTDHFKVDDARYTQENKNGAL